MSDRREFLKGVGALGVLPLARPLLAESSRVTDQKVSNEQAAPVTSEPGAGAVVLENAEMRLVIRSDGSAQSLVHKPSGQECLDTEAHVPMFTVTQYRPLDNELQLAYPAKTTHFPADHVRREGDKLIVAFALVGYEGTIGLSITDAYIAFRLEELTYKGYTPVRPKQAFPLDETIFLQLPVRPRKNFGDWLNVMWDDQVAVNVLATDVETEIDATPCDGHFLLHAGSLREVKLKGVGAALIATATPNLLNCIARVEEDFHLPKGVQSRQSKEIRYSYYQAFSLTPKDVDRQIKYAKMGGFRQFMIYCMAFSKTVGHFPWNADYPNGIDDLREVVGKVTKAGMLPGLHILYTMAHEEDAYVTPKPDPRLALIENYTLAGSLDSSATTIPIEENPRLATMDQGKRILRIQNELISYERYTAEPPYRFEGCGRGALGTDAAAHEVGSRVGVLDMYGGGSPAWLFARFSQNTSLQADVAERLKSIYEQAGFKYLYFDGAEQVTRPYWYTIPLAQGLIADSLQPKPVLAEGSCKVHFSWHTITRGNAFDTAKPEEVKAAIRAYPAPEITRMVKDFTPINFGWLGYWAPTEKTIGTQPDMLEFASSVAAAWDCPISLSRGSEPLVDALDAHPRTPDNLETTRRWEEVRAQGWLSEKQKTALRNLEQEHTLLINERADFELVPWDQVENVAGADRPGRAFLFMRQGAVWAAYWHISGEGLLELPLPSDRLTLMRDLGKPLAIQKSGRGVRLPIGERRYLKVDGIARQEVVSAFKAAKILSS
ncbi:MAG: hypothetical protein ACLGRW_08395 [Acidobacteriota bacterium]